MRSSPIRGRRARRLGALVGTGRGKGAAGRRMGQDGDSGWLDSRVGSGTKTAGFLHSLFGIPRIPSLIFSIYKVSDGMQSKAFTRYKYQDSCSVFY
jgi:hypothetical protein